MFIWNEFWSSISNFLKTSTKEITFCKLVVIWLTFLIKNGSYRRNCLTHSILHIRVDFSHKHFGGKYYKYISYQLIHYLPKLQRIYFNIFIHYNQCKKYIVLYYKFYLPSIFFYYEFKIQKLWYDYESGGIFVIKILVISLLVAWIWYLTPSLCLLNYIRHIFSHVFLNNVCFYTWWKIRSFVFFVICFLASKKDKKLERSN